MWSRVAAGRSEDRHARCVNRTAAVPGPAAQVTADARGATGTQKGKALSGVKHGVKNYSDSVYSG